MNENPMSDGGLRAAWYAEFDEADGTPSDVNTAEEVLMDVKKRTRKLARTTLRRDLAEAAATVLVLGVFGALAVTAGGVVPLIGFAIAMPFFVSPVVRLFRERRRHRRVATDRSVSGHLDAELDRVDGQIGLLSSVESWYLRPIAFAAVVTMAATASAFPPDAAAPVRCLVALGVGLLTAVVFAPVSRLIAAANRRAVDRWLRPLREDLERARAELRAE